jgi:hypothetical protein
MSAGSTHGTGSACISWEIGAKSSRVGFSRSGRNMRNVASFIAIGVFTWVGWMELTRMLCGASSIASVRISPTTPCLAAM